MPSPKRFRSSSCPYLGLNNLEKNPVGTLDLLSFNSSEIKIVLAILKDSEKLVHAISEEVLYKSEKTLI